MVYGFAKRSGKAPTWYELEHSILRNFGGLDGVEPLAVFKKRFETVFKDKQVYKHMLSYISYFRYFLIWETTFEHVFFNIYISILCLIVSDSTTNIYCKGPQYCKGWHVSFFRSWKQIQIVPLQGWSRLACLEKASKEFIGMQIIVWYKGVLGGWYLLWIFKK